MTENDIAQFKNYIKDYIQAYGWDALERTFINSLGFFLTEETTLDNGAIRRTYTHPNGSTVEFTYGLPPQE